MKKKELESAVTDFTHAIGILMRRIRATGAAHDISLTESAVLGRLAKQGPATIADLARAEHIKPQSMGTILAALTERGLVARRPHPTDGRQVHIDLTPKGAAVRKSTRDTRHNWLTQAIDGLDKRDQETLFTAGKIIKRLAENDSQ
jgi:DNA-binding MarR family transcriptional regulator